MGNLSCLASPRPAVPSSNRPFDQLPRDLRNDPRLKDGDVRLSAVLIGYARNKVDCWPSNARLAADLGVSVRTVQYRLARLVSAGWFRCSPARNPAGRVIVLVWREGVQPVAPLPMPNVAPKRDRVVKEKGEKKETPRTTRQDPEPPVLAPEPLRAPESPPKPSKAPEPPILPIPSVEPVQSLLGPLTAIRETSTRRGEAEETRNAPDGGNREAPKKPRRRLSLTVDELREIVRETGDPVLAAELAKREAPRPEPRPEPTSTAELIRRVKERPHYPPMLAHAFTVEFNDQGSYGGFLAAINRSSPEDLEDAYQQATGPQARNRGAVFMHALKRLRLRDHPPDGGGGCNPSGIADF